MTAAGMVRGVTIWTRSSGSEGRMRSRDDPSRGVTVICEANVEVTLQSGEKSGILADENDTGARSKSIEINRYDNSLRTGLPHLH